MTLHPDLALTLARARQREFEDRAARWRLGHVAKRHLEAHPPLDLKEKTDDDVEHQNLRAA
jgi:hypothetical protein